MKNNFWQQGVIKNEKTTLLFMPNHIYTWNLRRNFRNSIRIKYCNVYTCSYDDDLHYNYIQKKSKIAIYFLYEKVYNKYIINKGVM